VTQPADAVPDSLVARAPAAWRPYLQLSRADRPIGFWLLALPCVMGQMLGRVGEGVWLYDLALLALFVVGSIAMRGAGCTWNDLLDRDIDARVARTAGRPLASGAVTTRQAGLWLAAQLAVGFVVWLCLPDLAKWVALGAIPLVAAYPLMKRITWWPQAWLGLTFNWGVLVGYAAVQGSIGLEAILLYASCVAWTIGYDTIYAMQDVEDDALVGVRSTARLFGDKATGWIRFFYGAAAFLAGAAALAAGNTLWFVALFAPYAVHLFGQLRLLKPCDPVSALAVFRSNKITGILLVAAYALQAIGPQLSALV